MVQRSEWVHATLGILVLPHLLQALMYTNPGYVAVGSVLGIATVGGPEVQGSGGVKATYKPVPSWPTLTG